MLSYPIPEAEELLTNKLSAALQSLSNCEEDLDFLREQVTVRKATLASSLASRVLYTNLAVLYFPHSLRQTNTLISLDNGSRHSPRVQLGHHPEAQRGEGRRWQLRPRKEKSQ